VSTDCTTAQKSSCPSGAHRLMERKNRIDGREDRTDLEDRMDRHGAIIIMGGTETSNRAILRTPLDMLHVFPLITGPLPPAIN
jgi:hypothetical protein